MTKLLKVSPNSVQSEIGSQIEQLYSELTVKLEKFKDKLLKDWQRGLNPEIKERLKDFILVTFISPSHFFSYSLRGKFSWAPRLRFGSSSFVQKIRLELLMISFFFFWSLVDCSYCSHGF